jgi:membrane protein YdbS with pleckstrin-like domain
MEIFPDPESTPEPAPTGDAAHDTDDPGESPPTAPRGEPEPAPGPWYQLDRAYIRSEQLAGTILSLLVLAGCTVWLGIHWLDAGTNWFFWCIAGIGVLVFSGLMALAIFWPIASFRRTRWRLDETGLEIHKGVWWRHRIVIPMTRVQHADVSQGPLQRNYGIGTLTVHTAGTSNASVELSGLNYGVAMQIRDAIIRTRSPVHGS